MAPVESPQHARRTEREDVDRRSRRMWTWLLAAVAASFAAGVLTHRYWPRPQSIEPATLPTPSHVAIDCASVPRRGLMVALVLGQSNSANHGETRTSSRAGVFSFFDGRCFAARDPLPGATGYGGSVWTRLGDRLVASGLRDAVLFVPVGINSTSIEQWARSDEIQSRLRRAIERLAASGFRITHVLWQQGEADAKIGTSPQRYRDEFVAVHERLRSLGVDAPVYVALSTVCGRTQGEPIRAAQRALPGEGIGVRPGPDTDTLGREYRFDGCHFSERGLDRAAELWLEALRAFEKR